MRMCSAVLAPGSASPSAAVAGSAVRSFTCVNPSAAVPVAHCASSAAPGPAFLRLSATPPGFAFAPYSAAGLGFAYARSFPGDTFRAEIMPGNALVHARLSPGLPSTRLATECLSDTDTCFSGTCFLYVCFTRIYHSEIFLFVLSMNF